MKKTVIFLAVFGMCLTLSGQAYATEVVKIPAGKYRSLYSSQASPLEWVKSFLMDKTAVTNRQFYEFVKRNPQWQKTKVPEMFAEESYLNDWVQDKAEYKPQEQDLDAPVTYVSWFAAQAYCKAQGKHLPTIAEWEFVGKASETNADGRKEDAYIQRILKWYENHAPEHLAHVGQSEPNYYGVQDMHGLIWEWAQDFSGAKQYDLKRSNFQDVDKDGRTLSLNIGAFCGAAAEGVADPSDYAAFMRYGFRNSLKAQFTIKSLGFRCASEIE